MVYAALLLVTLYKRDVCQINATVKLKWWYNWNSQCWFSSVRCFAFFIRKGWPWFQQPLSYISTHGKWMRAPNNKRDLKKKWKEEKANQNELCISKEYLQLELPLCRFLLVKTWEFFSTPPATALSTKLFLTWTNVCILKYCGMYTIWPEGSLS